jgi:hypothetical protein
MFKISVVETRGQRRLVLEGKLVAPWTHEVESAWRQAKGQVEKCRLIVDFGNVTLIGHDGEATLLNLMRDGARFTTCGVLTKHLLKQLARRCRCQH